MAPTPPSEEKDHRELLARVREQEAALATYKETLGRIYQEFDAKIEELSLIRRVSDVLRASQDLTSLALGLVEVVISELPADLVALMLADPELTNLRPVALMRGDWEAPRPVVKPGPRQLLPLGQGSLGLAVSLGQVLLLPDLQAPGARPKPWPADLPKKARSLLVLPLVARQQILGAMFLVGMGPGAFGQEQTRALTIICDHAAAALANVHLIDQLGEINERLLASELEAHQAKEYLQHVLDNAADLILIADKQGAITYANQAAASLGLVPTELPGKPMADLFAEPARLDRLLARADPLSEELELVAGEEQTLLTLVSVTPLVATGETLAIIRDITRRKALERQLMHAEKLASVGILAAGVAHEIGNPLSAVSGYAQLLTKDDISEEERKEFAAAIASQAERINRIIRDLLDYSRPSPYQGQATDVNQAIEAVLNMFFTSKRLAHQHLSIHRDLARDLPSVRIDRDQLQQVALNLIMNAAQAMEGGGSLTIATDTRQGWVALAFSDSGPGIPPGHLPLVFDPFFTTKPPGQGTGLGLSICDRIISAAGGRIEVASTLGKGTTFTVWLPGAGE